MPMCVGHVTDLYTSQPHVSRSEQLGIILGLNVNMNVWQ